MFLLIVVVILWYIHGKDTTNWEKAYIKEYGKRDVNEIVQLNFDTENKALMMKLCKKKANRNDRKQMQEHSPRVETHFVAFKKKNHDPIRAQMIRCTEEFAIIHSPHPKCAFILRRGNNHKRIQGFMFYFDAKVCFRKKLPKSLEYGRPPTVEKADLEELTRQCPPDDAEEEPLQYQPVVKQEFPPKFPFGGTFLLYYLPNDDEPPKSENRREGSTSDRSNKAKLSDKMVDRRATPFKEKWNPFLSDSSGDDEERALHSLKKTFSGRPEVVIYNPEDDSSESGRRRRQLSSSSNDGKGKYLVGSTSLQRNPSSKVNKNVGGSDLRETKTKNQPSTLSKSKSSSMLRRPFSRSQSKRDDDERSTSSRLQRDDRRGRSVKGHSSVDEKGTLLNKTNDDIWAGEIEPYDHSEPDILQRSRDKKNKSSIKSTLKKAFGLSKTDKVEKKSTSRQSEEDTKSVSSRRSQEKPAPNSLRAYQSSRSRSAKDKNETNSVSSRQRNDASANVKSDVKKKPEKGRLFGLPRSLTSRRRGEVDEEVKLSCSSRQNQPSSSRVREASTGGASRRWTRDEDDRSDGEETDDSPRSSKLITYRRSHSRFEKTDTFSRGRHLEEVSDDDNSDDDFIEGDRSSLRGSVSRYPNQRKENESFGKRSGENLRRSSNSRKYERD